MLPAEHAEQDLCNDRLTARLSVRLSVPSNSTDFSSSSSSSSNHRSTSAAARPAGLLLSAGACSGYRSLAGTASARA